MTVLPDSTTLPAEAREMLQRAAQTPVTKAAPLARTKALELADQRVRLLYPQFFTTEKE